MQHNKEMIIETLNQAIQLEKDGLENYLEFALTTEDPTGKNMFINLARDEFFHMNIIEEIIIHYENEGSWKIIPMKHSLFQEIKPTLEDIDYFSRGKEELNQIHALEMAMKFESRSRDKYDYLASLASPQEAKNIFEKLAQMEQNHYNILEIQKASITETGLWLEIAPQGMESLV